MEPSLSAILDFYVFPTGRRLFALRRVAERAKAASFTELVKHCGAAIAHDQKCLELEGRWAGIAAARKGKSAPAAPAAVPVDAAAIDPLVDHTLTAIRDHAQSQTAGAPADDPIHAIVSTFLREVFPTGVQEVTGLPYVEELAAVEHIVRRLQGGELAVTVKELGLLRLTKRLGMLAEQYRAALEAPAPETLAFGEVKAARAAGQEHLLQAVAIVLGKHYKSTPADVAARTELLGPILEQNEAIGALMRARRTVEDIHPDTGTPDPTAAAPPPEKNG